ncbi:hypothetical protein N8083_01465 [Candidatus Pacebacteria bacterium]|nr:hypothetical protein [Candidatus Paceibacterota bacterium]
MALPARSITWEAPAHQHIEKTSDWFWALGIIAISAGTAAFFFNNFLLAILILIAAAIMALLANREPEVVAYAITSRGLRVGDRLYPYSTLEAFYIDEDHEAGPQLFARSKKLFMHLIIMPLPHEHIEDVEDILESKLPEEHIEEPLATKIFEIFGF